MARADKDTSIAPFLATSANMTSPTFHSWHLQGGEEKFRGRAISRWTNFVPEIFDGLRKKKVRKNFVRFFVCTKETFTGMHGFLHHAEGTQKSFNNNVEILLTFPPKLS